MLQEKILGKNDFGYTYSFEVKGVHKGTITEILDMEKAIAELTLLGHLKDDMEYRASGMFDVSSAENSARRTLREMLILKALDLGGTHIWLSQSSDLDAGFVTGMIRQEAEVFRTKQS